MGVLALCARISGPIVIGFFFLGGILAFSISCGQYNAQKDDRFEYFPPPNTVIAFHWMCCIFGTTLGVGLLLASFGGFWGLCLVVASSMFLLVFWICYMVFFFISDQFKMNDEAVTMGVLDGLWANMVKECPYADVYGTGEYVRTYYSSSNSRRKKKSRTPCRTKSFRVYSEKTCSDATTLVDLPANLFDDVPAVRVIHEVYPTFASDEEDYYLVKAKDLARDCVRNNNDRVSSAKGNVAYGVEPVPSMLFLTKDGAKPAAVSKGRAIAAGIFFCGITYSYGISKIPVVRQKVYKENVTLSKVDMGNNYLCGRIGKCDT